MPERRSGVDIVARDGGWAVVYSHKLLSFHAEWRAAVTAARMASRQILKGRLAFGQGAPLARLLDDRRHVHKPGGASDDL